MKKEFGGLGIPDLRDLNLCLLGSWIRRYTDDDNQLWKQLIDYKYNTRSPNVFPCRDVNASQFWKGVLWAGQVAKFGYRWKIGNGKHVKFWEDNWLTEATRQEAMEH